MNSVILFLLSFIFSGKAVCEDKVFGIISFSNEVSFVKNEKLFVEKIIESAKYSSFTLKDVIRIYNTMELVENNLIRRKKEVSSAILISQISEAIISINDVKITLTKLTDIVKSKSYGRLRYELLNLEEELYRVEVYIAGLNICFSRSLTNKL